MVDTHAHLGLCEPEADELVEAARRAGVRRILTVGIDEESSRAAVSAAGAYEEVFACVGHHPNGAGRFDEKSAAAIEELAGDQRVAAIGETGLDLYRDKAPLAEQRDAFATQIEIAERAGKPVVIHVRDRPDSTEARDEVLDTLAERAGDAGVILHCFSLAPDRVPEVAQRGWYCSFAGNLTYPKAKELREAARAVPAENLLVETDSPFLTPQAARGKPNQPANVVATARTLAELREISYEELEALVEANAARAFGW